MGFLCGSLITYYLMQQITYKNEDANENQKDNDKETKNNYYNDDNDGLQYYIYEKYM